MDIDNRLKSMAIELPTAPAPVGSYVPAVRSGNLLYLSGAICMANGAMTHTGKVGEQHDLQGAYQAARVCALNLLANMRKHAGGLNKVSRIVMLTGYVNSVPGFADSPSVINGASDLFAELFGDHGRHARAAVSVAGLPMDSTVEISAVIEVID